MSTASTPGSQSKETYVYNVGVERQFFDAVKAALTSFSRDGQAWADFIKTLDMYAQEILSRSDTLGCNTQAQGAPFPCFPVYVCARLSSSDELF